MQENNQLNSGVNKNMIISSEMKQKSVNPIIHILSGFGIAVVAFGLGYFFRGYSTKEYMVAEIVSTESIVQEVVVTPLPIMEDDSEYVYTSKELGFSLILPEKFQVDKVMNDQYNQLVSFKNESAEIMVSKDDAPTVLSFEDMFILDQKRDYVMTVDGEPANVYEYSMGANSCDGVQGPCIPKQVIIYTGKDSEYFNISFFGDSVLDDSEKKILDSFQFFK